MFRLVRNLANKNHAMSDGPLPVLIRKRELLVALLKLIVLLMSCGC